MVLFPVKKALVAVAARVKSRKDGKLTAPTLSFLVTRAFRFGSDRIGSDWITPNPKAGQFRIVLPLLEEVKVILFYYIFIHRVKLNL